MRAGPAEPGTSWPMFAGARGLGQTLPTPPRALPLPSHDDQPPGPCGPSLHPEPPGWGPAVFPGLPALEELLQGGLRPGGGGGPGLRGDTCAGVCSWGPRRGLPGGHPPLHHRTHPRQWGWGRGRGETDSAPRPFLMLWSVAGWPLLSPAHHFCPSSGSILAPTCSPRAIQSGPSALQVLSATLRVQPCPHARTPACPHTHVPSHPHARTPACPHLNTFPTHGSGAQPRLRSAPGSGMTCGRCGCVCKHTAPVSSPGGPSP